MTHLLEVKNLTTRFYTEDGVVHAVSGISYTVDEGESLGIVGESGSGKSVGVKSIMRLIPSPPGRIEEGEVIFNERDLLKLSDDEIRRIRGRDIAMIFQDPMTSLNPVLTIGLQMTEGLQLHLGMNQEQAENRAVEMMSLVGIPDARARLKDYPHEFSGGQRQRIGIARAIALRPKFIICDEPVSALDVSIQSQVLNLLQDLQEEFGLTYLFIAHNLSVVEHISDRVAVMYLGKIVELAPRQELYNNPLHPYTQALMSAIPIPKPNLNRERVILEGEVPSPLNPPEGCRFHPRCPVAMARCSVEEPEFLEDRQDHWAACFRV